MFKTLQQVEPRRDVQTLPAGGGGLYFITAPGSYYLTTNIIGAPGFSGIAIMASDVTLDLNGFALLGTTSSLHGITVLGTQNNIEIRTGSIERWGLNGINASATDCRYFNLRCSRNTGNGFALGPRSVVTECQSASNAMNGFSVVSGIIKNCIAIRNGNYTNAFLFGTHGFFLTGPPEGTDQVKDCVADYNLTDGIQIGMAFPGRGSIISGCTAKGNGDDGIQVSSHCFVRDNNCLSNVVSGIHVVAPGMGNRIEENHVSLHPTGFLLDPPAVANFIVKNTAEGNTIGYVVPPPNHMAAITFFPGVGFVVPDAWANFEF
jgi:hypothetical protein